MLGSYRLLRQMAQVSVQIAQDHLQKRERVTQRVTQGDETDHASAGIVVAG
jgi:hypothetical protein